MTPLDFGILAFTLALTGITGVVFGLLPAWRASRSAPWSTLKDTMGSIAGVGGSLFMRKGLVTVQVALSFLLLFGAGFSVALALASAFASSYSEAVALKNLTDFDLVITDLDVDGPVAAIAPAGQSLSHEDRPRRI